MTAEGVQRVLIHKIATASAGALLLSGCATFGGNVRGSFSCSAPDGVCAPSATIDDRALAMVSADTGGDSAASPSPARIRSFHPATNGSEGPPRSREKVLKIVFLPFIDDRGRLHDTSVIHAVVANGDWMSPSTGFANALPGEQALARGPGETLSDAVDRADPPGGEYAVLDPNAPDPAAVAAARARRADPVGAIKADVAARLAPASGSKAQKAAEELVLPPPISAPPARGTPFLAPAAADHEPAGRGDGGDGIRNDPASRNAAAAISGGARGASAAAAGSAALIPAPVVRASDFPASMPEDD